MIDSFHPGTVLLLVLLLQGTAVSQSVEDTPRTNSVSSLVDSIEVRGLYRAGFSGGWIEGRCE